MFFVIANLQNEIRQAFILTLNMRPKLEYASVISNLCTNDNITVLEKIRLKAVRFIFLFFSFIWSSVFRGVIYGIPTGLFIAVPAKGTSPKDFIFLV